MTIYVDNAFIEHNNSKWCHLIGDTEKELHYFALMIGLELRWFQSPPKVKYPHYDIVETKRKLAVQLGAVEVSTRELIKILKCKKA